jgi:hypothetical protein
MRKDRGEMESGTGCLLLILAVIAIALIAGLQIGVFTR